MKSFLPLGPFSNPKRQRRGSLIIEKYLKPIFSHLRKPSQVKPLNESMVPDLRVCIHGPELEFHNFYSDWVEQFYSSPEGASIVGPDGHHYIKVGKGNWERGDGTLIILYPDG